jgi:hypothetical protein
MSVHTRPAEYGPALPADFAERLEQALDRADRRRRKRAWYRRSASLLPVLLLIGPIIAWRLMSASPDGVHVGIAALAWVTFLLDVGVHLDTSVLTYCPYRLAAERHRK